MRRILGALVAAELRLAEQNRAAFEATWHRFARPRSASDCRAVLRKLRALQPQPARETPTHAASPARLIDDKKNSPPRNAPCWPASDDADADAFPVAELWKY